jgi:SAM-dependent methyltransferase
MAKCVALNVGAGPGWQKPGWATTDHKRSLLGGGSAWRIDHPDCTFDLLFSSHMLEHIPHFKIDAVLNEFNRVLKPGAVVRLLCPDLAVIARAYVERDGERFDELRGEDGTIRSDLSFGGMFMNFVVSGGSDMFAISRNGECIGGYAHVYAYDFEMLRILLERHGFGNVRRRGFLESERSEFREPLHPVGSPAIWTRESEWTDRSRGLTGFDRDPESSLIVEAVKIKRVSFTAQNFGQPGIRGLDPRSFSWRGMTIAYLAFTAHKLRALPRALAAGVLALFGYAFPTGTAGRRVLKSVFRAALGNWIRKA